MPQPVQFAIIHIAASAPYPHRLKLATPSTLGWSPRTIAQDITVEVRFPDAMLASG